MTFDLSTDNVNKVNAIKHQVENNSEIVNNIINDIVKPYTDQLDNYVDFIANILRDGENPPTAQELDDFCMNLSVYIYYASGMQEQLGIKDDIARAIHKEIYHATRDSLIEGTVADKDSIAELGSQSEYLTSMIYKRAYAQVKAKVSAAQELLSSCKKIISRRMSEYSLTNISGNR